jgi:hypothetical protein
MRSIWLSAALLAACSSGPPTETGSPTDPPTEDTDVVETGDTGIVHTGDTGDTDDTDEPPVVIDCSALPQGPFQIQQLQSPRAYHGLTFDDAGNLFSHSSGSIFQSTSGTDTNIVIPNAGFAEQIEMLETGELIVASNNLVKYVQGQGSVVLASGLNAYGVTIGPDGMVYTANNQDVHRIDPATGDVEVYLDFPNNISPKVLDFNVDLSRMYVGTLATNGAVYEVELDANFDPVGVPTLLGNTGGSWHDGLRVDACNRIYIPEYYTSSLYIMDATTGQSQVLIDYAFDAYGHGIAWGSGIGPWDDHTIFVPQPYDGDRVAAIPLGVPYRTYNDGNFVTVP